jgi:hypothetical protein
MPFPDGVHQKACEASAAQAPCEFLPVTITESKGECYGATVDLKPAFRFRPYVATPEDVAVFWWTCALVPPRAAGWTTCHRLPIRQRKTVVAATRCCRLPTRIP